MTQRHLLIAVLIISSFPSMGQELAIKLGPVIRAYNFSSPSFEMAYAPSLIIERKERTLHQISLESGRLNHVDFVTENDQGEIIAGRKEFVYNTGLRYQAAYMFGEKSDKFHPFLGASFGLYTTGKNTNPYVSNEYALSYFETGGRFGIVAGMRATVMRQFFIDLDLAAGVLGFGIARNSTDNPNLPIRQQTTSIVFLDGPINQIRASAAVGMYLRYQRN